MELKAKRKQAESVRKHFSSRIVHLGFARTKPTFWTRADEVLAQFVHLHLFTHSPSFRLHLGVRVLNDSFPAPALNGPMSHDGWGVGKRKYVFGFSKAPDSAPTCADELAAFLLDVGLPWFERFGSPDSVLAPDGPLGDDSKRLLKLALSGHQDEVAIAASRTMLGLAT